MTALLEIESRFLTNPMVVSGLQLDRIQSLQEGIRSSKKLKFHKSLELGQTAIAALDWYKSDDCQYLMQDEGIVWTTEEFIQKVFKIQKSFFYKVVKAAKIAVEHEDVLVSYLNKVDEMEAEGENPVVSVEEFTKYFKLSTASVTAPAGGEGDNEGEEGEETDNEPVIAVNPTTVLTFTVKHEDGNIAVRVNSDGELSTTNLRDDILLAIDSFRALIVERFQ